jgi:hypothetical protein
MRKPSVKLPRRREPVWGLDEIIKYFDTIPDFADLIVRLEPAFVIYYGDEAIKRNWAELWKDHPIQAAITLACAKRRNQSAETDEGARVVARREEVMRLTTWLPEDEWRRALRTGLEIRPLPTEEQRLKIAELMLNSGFPESVIRPVLKTRVQRNRGRPPEKRDLFVRALEAKMVRPRLSWAQLFRQRRTFQPPGQECTSADSIHKGVGELCRELIKYQVELPPSWLRIELLCQEGKNPQH